MAKTIYCGRNRRGIWKASEDESKVERFDKLFETEVTGTIHNNKVYMITVYHGFDYNYGGNPGICDDTRHVSKVFHSVSAARKDPVWQSYLNKAKENPKEHHVSDFRIASDAFGEPFSYGDVMEGKFNAQIIGVRLI